MHRIDTPTAQRDKFGQGKNGFTRGNPQTGTPATQLDYLYCDAIQEEIANAIELAGITLDKSKQDQLATAIKTFSVKKTGDNMTGELNINGRRVLVEGDALPATKIVVNGIPTYSVCSSVVFKDAIGEFRLMPFRAGKLPFGWYFRNGDNYLLTSPQGKALNGLSDNYKHDHRITIKEIDGQQYINVPSAFAPDGRGYFERPVDGTTRQVGSVQNDAIRNIYGSFYPVSETFASEGQATGVFKKTQCFSTHTPSAIDGGPGDGIVFDASLVVPTSNENRPLNIGLTPAIYLGV